MEQEIYSQVQQPTDHKDSLGGLVREVGNNAFELAKCEVALAKLDVQIALKRAAVGMAGVVLGGILTLFGLGLLCMTGVAALAPLIPALWLRMLFMSLVYLLLGTLLCVSFVGKLKQISFGNSAVTQARRTLEELSELPRA